MTEEQILEGRKSLLKSMGFDEGLAKDEPNEGKTAEQIEADRVAAETKSTEDAAAAEAKKAEELAAEAEREAAGAHTPTADEREQALVDRTVRATTEAMKEFLPKPQAAPMTPEIAALNPEDQADLEAIQYLESNKRVPAGMKQTMLKYYQDCAAYRAKWQAENPGKEFDPEEDDHKAYLLSIQPDIDLEMVDEAREEVRIEKLVEKRVKPMEEARAAERTAAQITETLEKAKPVIHNDFRKSLVKFIDQVSPAALEILKDKDGKLDLSPEAIARLEKEDPVAKEVLDAVAGQELHPVVVELGKWDALGQHWNWDTRNPIHGRILDEIGELEQIFSKAPASVRVQNGKEFITAAGFSAKANEIRTGSGSDAQKRSAMEHLTDSTWIVGTAWNYATHLSKKPRSPQKKE